MERIQLETEAWDSLKFQSKLNAEQDDRYPTVMIKMSYINDKRPMLSLSKFLTIKDQKLQLNEQTSSYIKWITNWNRTA